MSAVSDLHFLEHLLVVGGRFEKSSFHLANSLANTCQINQHFYSGGGIIISAESTCSSY